MSIERVKELFNERLTTIGQIGGWGSGIAAKAWTPESPAEWFLALKEAIGFIGLLAGATLSCLALYDWFRKRRAEKRRARMLE